MTSLNAAGSAERCCLDASALLASILGEPVHAALKSALDEGVFMSAANYAEVASKLTSLGSTPQALAGLAERMNVIVVPLTEELASMAGELEPVARPYGLSLADRCCVATAEAFNAQVLTTDRAWLELPKPLADRVVYVRPE